MADILFFIGFAGVCYGLGRAHGEFIQGRKRAVAAMHHARKRRPVSVTIDYDLAVAALNNSGYKVVRVKERLH